MPALGPAFTTRKPRFNHVAMSLTPEMLDEEHRKLRADFFGDAFGFFDIPMMTVDRKRQVFQVHNIEQFLFLIAEDEPMTCPRMDHYGFAVGTLDELVGARDRAVAFREDDSRVDLIDLHVDDQEVVKIHSIYVRYLLPMMCQLQFWEFPS